MSTGFSKQYNSSHDIQNLVIYYCHVPLTVYRYTRDQYSRDFAYSENSNDYKIIFIINVTAVIFLFWIFFLDGYEKRVRKEEMSKIFPFM